jgi:fructose-1-phosphate kinase PfkB-like protein
MLHRLLIAFAITLLNASVLFAQNTAGKIVGTVSAADGAVAGATVTVTDEQTGKERTVTSNGEGAFEVFGEDSCHRFQDLCRDASKN